MKKWIKRGSLGILVLMWTLMLGMTVQAKGSETIKTGIFADGIDLSGLSEEEASSAINAYVEELKSVEVSLIAAQNQEVVVTAGDLGIVWANPELVSEAMEIGKHGNVIERYKILKDLEHENKIYKIELDFDVQAINNILTEKCTKYDQEAVNMSLKRTNGQFEIVEGQTGYMLDVEASIDAVYNYLTMEWNHEPCSISLSIAIDEPKGTAEELAEVKDVLGSFTTSYATSGTSRSANVTNGCKLINGITLYPGEEFSTENSLNKHIQHTL